MYKFLLQHTILCFLIFQILFLDDETMIFFGVSLILDKCDNWRFGMFELCKFICIRILYLLLNGLDTFTTLFWKILRYHFLAILFLDTVVFEISFCFFCGLRLLKQWFFFYLQFSLHFWIDQVLRHREFHCRKFSKDHFNILCVSRHTLDHFIHDWDFGCEQAGRWLDSFRVVASLRVDRFVVVQRF
mgnify:CR=1 FL=1